jgi:tetratricopeptide (TPR) repeat protein
MSKVHFSLGDDASGIEFLLKRLDWEIQDKSDYGQYITLKALGKAYERSGKKPEALAAYDKALLLSKSLIDFWGTRGNEIDELKAALQRLR